MLIEVRSSPNDTNNTPEQLFQRFNETLILKPRSKIALVSALITTKSIGGFRIDGNNQTMTLKVGSASEISFDIPIGDYSIKSLCEAIQTALRANLPKVQASGVSQTLYKDLFYPDTSIVCAKSANDIVTIKFSFDPQGFTSQPPLATANTDTLVSSTNLNLNFAGKKNGVIMRSRAEINNVNVGVISKEDASGFNAVNAILPYAKGAGTGNHHGVFQADRVIISPRQQHFGLNQSEGLLEGEWLLPSANPYTAGAIQYRFDNYTGVGGTSYGYNWVVVFGATNTTYYLAKDGYEGTNEFGVNVTHKAIDPNSYDQSWEVLEKGDSSLGASIDIGGADELEPLPNVFINRGGLNNYDLQLNPNGHLRVQYGGVLLNTPTNTILKDGDGVRWYVDALDNSTIKTKHPIPEISRDGINWTEVLLNEGKKLPDVNVNDILLPAFHSDGLVEAGTIGNGAKTDTNLTTSFLASNMSITDKIGNFFSGEVLYQTGETTPPNGKGMKLMAVSSNTMGVGGALTGVLVMGNGYQGTGYETNMSFGVKGLVSGSTATIGLASPAVAIATITDGGDTYTQGNEYSFILNAGGSPPNPPLPFVQNGRFTRSGKVSASAVGAGAITEVTFLDGGNGFMVGDTIEIQSNGAGDGDGLARITIQQVCEDANQLFMASSGSFDTKNLGGAFPPMLSQDQIELNTKDLGQMLRLLPNEYNGSVGSGVNQPIITGSETPTPNNPANENILIDLPSMPINSRNSGRQDNQDGGNTDNHIATIPYQTDLTETDEFHKQHYEPFNMIYHSLDNEADLNLNSLSVRLTNFDGTLRTDIAHPTQLTFSIQPDYL